jgi:hypothetical protein
VFGVIFSKFADLCLTSGATLNQTLEKTKVMVRNYCVKQLNDGFDIKQWWNDYCYDEAIVSKCSSCIEQQSAKASGRVVLTMKVNNGS